MTAVRLSPTPLLAAGLLSLAACATIPPPPSDALQAADIAVANAETEHAADYAPVEMRSAREKIAGARGNTATPEELRSAESRRLAEEARADAELATAQARLAKANGVNQELQKNGETLRNEIQRGPGV